jgi:hypothetical protein
LQKHCMRFEDHVRKWIAEVQCDQSKLDNLNILKCEFPNLIIVVSAWKQMQTRFPPPQWIIYEKVTKLGHEGKAKTCRRCNKVKDGLGRGKGHPRDHCTDNFPSWEAVPFPLPLSLNLTYRINGKTNISLDGCISGFRQAYQELQHGRT